MADITHTTMKRTLLITLLLSSLTLFAQQTGSIQGTVTDSQSEDVRPIANHSSFDSHDAYYDKVEYFMDPEYWHNYNIIEPSE